MRRERPVVRRGIEEVPIEGIRVPPDVLKVVLLHRIMRKLDIVSDTLRKIDRRLESVEAKGIPFHPARIHQGKVIKAGEHGVVYEYVVLPRTYVAFIHYVGCKWFPNTYYLWEIDGIPKEKVERAIGDSEDPVSEPLRLPRPVIAREKIRWVAYNNDTVDHAFEVLCDGVLYPRRVAKYLGGAEPSRG